ncbi:MAG: hypothetical protein QOF24_306 [Verrucomicrobiota bacterium]|jgi:hypothetical protein
MQSPSASSNPSYFSRTALRAINETWSLVFANHPWTVCVGVTIAGLAIFLQRSYGGQSTQQMKEALVSAAWVIVAYGAVFVFTFLFHFLYLSPKHQLTDVENRLVEAEKQKIESAALKPDFFYQGNGSEISIQWRMPPGAARALAVITFLLRFENRGQATAYNIGSKLYGCWIHDDPPRAVLIDQVNSVGRTAVSESKNLGFSADRKSERPTGTHILNIHKNILVVLVEISFRLGLDDPVIHHNAPIWLTWTLAVRDRMTDSTETDLSIAKPLIDDLKLQASARERPS